MEQQHKKNCLAATCLISGTAFAQAAASPVVIAADIALRSSTSCAQAVALATRQSK